jgi:hypothetical protein
MSESGQESKASVMQSDRCAQIVGATQAETSLPLPAVSGLLSHFTVNTKHSMVYG